VQIAEIFAAKYLGGKSRAARPRLVPVQAK